MISPQNNQVGVGPPFFWNTCYHQYCTSFVGSQFDGSSYLNAPFPWNSPTQFLGGWLSYNPVGFRVTAWGFQYPTTSHIDFFYGDDAFNFAAPNLFGFNSNSLTVAVNTKDWWEFAVGGDHYEASAMQGLWIGAPPSLSDIRFAWRGELEDRSLIFDCIQPTPESNICTTLTPEPSIISFLLIGFVITWLMTRVLNGKRKSRHG